jgi:alkane 1-monooxygenase
LLIYIVCYIIDKNDGFYSITLTFFEGGMSSMRYLIAYIFPVLGFWALGKGGLSLWVIPVFTFVVIPIMETIFVGTEENLSQEEVNSRNNDKFYSWLLYGMLPLQVALVVYFCCQMEAETFSGWSILSSILTVGICCGAFGINVGHELGHRNNKIEQVIAKGLLLTSLYMHFYIEHNRGHHLRVATPEDPATSKFNSTVYHFWGKSVCYGYMSAWALEKRRLERKRLPSFHWRNEMIWFQVIQCSTVAAIGLVFGLLAMISFIGAALVGILLLETINYIEHYGLERVRRSNGKYERVQPHHSWNSNHPIGRTLLFELTRHSDHHAFSNRHYPTLRHFEKSPQLPYGYPAMIVVALFPPLWFAIMNPHVNKELQRLERIAS